MNIKNKISFTTSSITLLLSCLILTAYSPEKPFVQEEDEESPKRVYQIGTAKLTAWEYKDERHFLVEKVYLENKKMKRVACFGLTEKELFELKSTIDKTIAAEKIRMY